MEGDKDKTFHTKVKKKCAPINFSTGAKLTEITDCLF
jgi:hypothetical protein